MNTSGFSLPAGTVTVVLADSVVRNPGRTLDAGAASEMAVAFSAILDALVEGHGGIRLDDASTGSSEVMFSSVGEAIDFALAARAELAVAGIPIRIAVHTGDLGVEEVKWGAARLIERADRLRRAGNDQEILLSAAAFAIYENLIHDDVNVVDVGLHRAGDLSFPERIFLLQQRPTGTAPAAVPALGSPHNLPRPRTSFVGRAEEVLSVRNLVAKERLVTLVGSGGCGKTRLAIHVAAGLVDNYPDGVWLTELAPVIDPQAVAFSVAAVLGVKVRPGTAAIEAVTRHLADRNALLVLDNCEHVVEASAVLVNAIQASCASVRIVATSRQPLGVSGEVTQRLFISARTVQTHLTHIFAKLSISTRTELAVEAGRRTPPPAN